MQSGQNQIIYATLGRRVKASILDSVIVLALIILIPIIMGQIKEGLLDGWGVLMYAPIFFLEPLLVSYWGQTVGQYLWGIKVVRETDLTKCPLVLSFVRYYAKALLGWWSMIYMFFSNKHKAIHDYLAHTVVILSPHRLAIKPWFAEQGVIEQEPEKGFVYPSALRRFGFFFIWWCLAIIGLDRAADAFLSLIFGKVRAAQLMKLGDPLVTILGLILLVIVASLAANGLLPGARRRRHTVTESTGMRAESQDCKGTESGS